jgi:hypothetical protein
LLPLPPPPIRDRVDAIRGRLLGTRAKVYISDRRGKYAEVGEVTGIGYPLVRLTCGDDQHYRHVDQIEVLGR